MELPDDMPQHPVREPECLKLFRWTLHRSGSALHLETGEPPQVRMKGIFQPMDMPPLTAEQLTELIDPLMNVEQRQTLHEAREVEFPLTLEGKSERFSVKVTRVGGDLRLDAQSV
jgi:Tfp pilus assembly pilus retraction ATPase PilT